MSSKKAQNRLRACCGEALENRRLMAVMTVTNLVDDHVDALAGDGQLSLREAVAAINTGSDIDGISPTQGVYGIEDQIIFDPALFAEPQKLDLINSGFQLDTSVDIIGPGRDLLSLNVAKRESTAVTFVLTNAGEFSIQSLTIAAAEPAAPAPPSLKFNGLMRAIGTDVSVTVENVAIIGVNDAPNGRAAFDVAPIRANGAHVVLRNSTVDGFFFVGRFGDEGAIKLTNARLDVFGSKITSNYGEAINSLESEIRIENSELSRNFFEGVGGISAQNSTISVVDSLFEENSGALGTGAIQARNSNLTIVGSAFVRNSNREEATGAIYAENSNTHIDRSTIRNSSGGFSGGIEISGGELILSNSTVSGNRTSGTAAGLAAFGAEVTIFNSTFSGNVNEAMGAVSCGSSAGAIAISQSSVTITNSTIVDNAHVEFIGDQGPTDCQSIQQRGGSLTLNNSIVAQSKKLVPPISEILVRNNGVFISQNSFIGAGDESGLPETGLTPDANGNLVGSSAQPIDPIVGALGNNGSSTLTHAILPGSPLIDAGSNELAVGTDGSLLEFDQTGQRRIARSVDIGAHEYRGLVADLDGDGDVDSADRLVITQNWTGALLDQDRTFSAGDADGDGDVDSADMTALLNGWTGAIEQAAPVAPNEQITAVDHIFESRMFKGDKPDNEFSELTKSHELLPRIRHAFFMA